MSLCFNRQSMTSRSSNLSRKRSGVVLVEHSVVVVILKIFWEVFSAILSKVLQKIKWFVVKSNSVYRSRSSKINVCCVWKIFFLRTPFVWYPFPTGGSTRIVILIKSRIFNLIKIIFIHVWFLVPTCISRTQSILYYLKLNIQVFCFRLSFYPSISR